MKIHPETNASYFGPNVNNFTYLFTLFKIIFKLEPLQLQKRRCNLIVPDKKNPE